MRKIFIIALLVALSLPATALAQEKRKGEVAANFTWSHSNFQDVLTYRPIGVMVEGTGYVNEWFGITGEFGWGTGTGDLDIFWLPIEVNIDTMTFMGGARFRFANNSRVTPSLRAVGGGLNAKASYVGFPDTETETGFSMAFGGAIDIDITERAAIRVQPDFITFWLDGTNDSMFRISFGGVFGF